MVAQDGRRMTVASGEGSPPIGRWHGRREKPPDRRPTPRILTGVFSWLNPFFQPLPHFPGVSCFFVFDRSRDKPRTYNPTLRTFLSLLPVHITTMFTGGTVFVLYTMCTVQNATPDDAAFFSLDHEQCARRVMIYRTS